MIDISAVNSIKSCGLNYRQFKVFLDETERDMVTLCTILKFNGLAKVRFCHIFYH